MTLAATTGHARSVTPYAIHRHAADAWMRRSVAALRKK
jgi:hypothetical protein